jgi:hypothetical protein
MHTAGSPWVDTDISVHAADHAREQKVTVVPSWPAMAASQQGLLLAVPVPDVASAGGGSDGSVVIDDELNDTVYDFWQFSATPSRARCR